MPGRQQIELSQDKAGGPDASGLRQAKRRIALRDSLTLFVLVLTTLALYAITSFVFRSFAAHRADLARRYAAEGRGALKAGRPEQAISALRVSLSYDPDDSTNHLLFAEALEQAHHSEEATNYFLALRDVEPADGFINLQLARLARQKHEFREAVDYYRASTLGNWQGDGVTARRQVQLEFADYLIQNGDLGAARSQILIAATNAPETPELDMLFGDRFLKAHDPNTALVYYRKAAKLAPHDFAALSKAGITAYQLADYSEAASLLTMAVKNTPAKEREDPEVAQAKALQENAKRILQLRLSDELPPQERVDHIQLAIPIAKKRLEDCVARVGTNGALTPELQSLQAQWESVAKLTGRRIRPDDIADQDAISQLIFNTEIQTARICGRPSGDDALLLLLAQLPTVANNGQEEQ